MTRRGGETVRAVYCRDTKEKKMTQAELAEKINVTDKAVSRWERGLGFPDIQTLEPLAQALGISVLELMRSKKKESTGDVDITETQYTRQEVAEMLQNADDISKQQKKQDKNAKIIAGILVIGVAAAAWAAKIANVGGGLVLGGLAATVFVSLWYFFQNLDDEESRRIYGAGVSIGYRELRQRWSIMSGETGLQNGFRAVWNERSRFSGHSGICL